MVGARDGDKVGEIVGDSVGLFTINYTISSHKIISELDQ